MAVARNASPGHPLGEIETIAKSLHRLVPDHRSRLCLDAPESSADSVDPRTTSRAIGVNRNVLSDLLPEATAWRGEGRLAARHAASGAGGGQGALESRRRAAMTFPLLDTLGRTRHRFVDVDGLTIFCREAGAATSPGLLLLHGFPTSSHMFRNLMPALAADYHVIAPDLPGFGFSGAPARAQFAYTFDHLADVIDRFTTRAGLARYAVYVFDYGAPVGFRLATRHPERISAIISQNGNAYEEGLSEAWNPIQRYWREPRAEHRAALREFLKPESVKWQYLHGVGDESLVAPESYTLDSAQLARPGNDEIQLDLFLDYASNVSLYPKFHEYFRTHQPPLLAVWGQNDPFFLPAGAEAFKRDIPGAVIRFLDTGHFALETHAAEIAAAVRELPLRS